MIVNEEKLHGCDNNCFSFRPCFLVSFLRQYSEDSSKHEILGIRQERPEQFAQQLNLDVGNAWGILHAIIDYCRELELGKYLILKDANNVSTRERREGVNCLFCFSQSFGYIQSQKRSFESEDSGSESFC